LETVDELKEIVIKGVTKTLKNYQTPNCGRNFEEKDLYTKENRDYKGTTKN